MREKTKVWRWIAVLAVFGLIAAACQGTTEEPETTDAPTPATTQAPAAATTVPPPTATGFTYQLGIISDPPTDNYWNYLDVNLDVYVQYVLGPSAGTLYTLTPPALTITPSLAAEEISGGTAEGDKWAITVPMIDSATWSDGEPITAHDVAFTFNTVKDVGLAGNWLTAYPLAAEGVVGIESVEAVDDTTVKFVWSSQPGLALWHYNSAQAPVLPEHFWAPHVAEALAAGEAAAAGVTDAKQAAFDAQKTAAEEAGEEFTKTVDDITDEEAAAYLGTIAKAESSAVLDAVSGIGAPSSSGFVYVEREEGAFWRNESVPGFWDTGVTYTVYDSGAVTVTDPEGVSFTVAGEPEGAVLAEYTVGPYAAEQLFQLYGTQDAAALALIEGEIDYWLNPLSLSRGLQGQFIDAGNLNIVANPSNGLFYFAFNVRRFPGNNAAYREAVACMVDKEFVAQNVLAGQVITVDSLIPPGNTFWANPNPVPAPCSGLGQVERLESAVQTLKDGGWTFEVEPVAEARDVTAGSGLTGPGGETLSEMTLYAPGPGYDPMRATYSLFIQNAMNDIGIPIVAEPTGFSTIVNIAFGPEADFDAYILGWSLTLFPDYVADFFITSADSTLGGLNTPGYSVESFDALGEELKTTIDLEKAQQIAWEMDAAIANDLPYITLFTNIAYDVFSNQIQFPFTQVLDGIQNISGGMPSIVTSS